MSEPSEACAANNGQTDQFMGVTGCSSEEALHFLEACGGDLSSAVNMFFQSGTGAETSGSRGSRRRGQKTQSVAAGGTNQNGHGQPDSLSNGADVIEEEEEEEAVRAPMQPTSGRLVPHTFAQSYAVRNPRAATNSIFDHSRDFRVEAEHDLAGVRRRVAHVPNIQNNTHAHNNQFNTTHQHSTSQQTSVEGQVEQQRQRLATLFRPPVDLIHQGNWDQVRAEGSGRDRWLLVNIQKVDEFACQVLNRDIWAHHAVRLIVQSNFLLWQSYHDSADGRRFSAYYQVHTYPHVVIIEPTTGELVLHVQVTDAQACCDALTTFLERYPEPSTYLRGDNQVENGNATTQHTNNATSSSKLNSVKRPAKRVHLDEDDIMMVDDDVHTGPTAKTSKSSSGESVNGSNSHSNPEEQSHSKTESDATCSLAECSHKQTTDQSAIDQFIVTDKQTTTLLVKTPAGDRVKVHVSLNSSVKALLRHLCVVVGLCADTHQFVLMYPRRVLNTVTHAPDQSLTQAGVLPNELIHADCVPGKK